MAAAPASFGRTSVRIAVIGDSGTGKSTLIASSAVPFSFSDNIPHVLPPSRIPADHSPDHIAIDLIDTSSRPEDIFQLITEVEAADAIVLTYDCNVFGTIDRLRTYWLPMLRHLKISAPVIVVGCKLNVPGKKQKLEATLFVEEFREIVAFTKCSLDEIQVNWVFLCAQKLVLHPTAPLIDRDIRSFNRRCVSALKRIFILHDLDMCGALSIDELSHFQLSCFNAHLNHTEILEIMEIVSRENPAWVNCHGLTFEGFLRLHMLSIKSGNNEKVWTVLRKFGYNINLEIRDDVLPLSILKCTSDQFVELTNEAVEFLKETFYNFNFDNDGALKPAEIDCLFSTAPENPWSRSPYKDATVENELGGLSLDRFLSKWDLMTLLDPAGSISNLIYIGYTSDPASAIHITPRKKLNNTHQQFPRHVYQCFVFGPKRAGKSALLDALIGRTFSEIYTPTTSERYAANLVELPGGIKKTLVMREVPEDHVATMLSKKKPLATCDIAVFVYDCSDEVSWVKAMKLLMEVASHVQRNGPKIHYLVVSAKIDLSPHSFAATDLTRISQAMSIETPLPVSVKLKHHRNVFGEIIMSLQRPHLHIPKSEAVKNQKGYSRHVNWLLVSVLAGIVVASVDASRTTSVAKQVVRYALFPFQNKTNG